MYIIFFSSTRTENKTPTLFALPFLYLFPFKWCCKTFGDCQRKRQTVVPFCAFQTFLSRRYEYLRNFETRSGDVTLYRFTPFIQMEK